MKAGILGGGFGLYGYLPALAALGCDIVLPVRYRDTVARRPELAGFADMAAWVASEDEMLAQIDTLVFARRPADQSAALPHILARANIKRLAIEKPLASSPERAVELHDLLARSGKIARIGYTFLHTPWAASMGGWRGGRGEASIAWRFRAHHYATRQALWKRLHAQGGGALRFYGIQVLAVLANLGYDRVAESRAVLAAGEMPSWCAVLRGPDLPDCRVLVDCDADQAEFTITSSTGEAIRLPDPFAQIACDGLQDRRVACLAALCRELCAGIPAMPASYAGVIALWWQAEEAAGLCERA